MLRALVPLITPPLFFCLFVHSWTVSIRPRDWVESDLTFVGFVSFAAKIRADSPVVIQSLVDSAHCVVMLTGDAPLTALHVAKEVNICARDKQSLILSVISSEESAKHPSSQAKVQWVGAAGEAFANNVKFPFVPSEVAELSRKYELLATEAAIEAAEDLSKRVTSSSSSSSSSNPNTVEAREVEKEREGAELKHGGVWDTVSYVKVFSRMSPHGKARVIRALQGRGHHVLMCGDGGNDVGALKQADVGLALLAGYGNSNTMSITGDSDDKGEEGGDKDGKDSKPKDKSAEDRLNQNSVEMKKKAEEAQKLSRQLMTQKQKELMALREQVCFGFCFAIFLAFLFIFEKIELFD
jgi:cation-transporting ATPase 13A1